MSSFRRKLLMYNATRPVVGNAPLTMTVVSAGTLALYYLNEDPEIPSSLLYRLNGGDWLSVPFNEQLFGYWEAFLSFDVGDVVQFKEVRTWSTISGNNSLGFASYVDEPLEVNLSGNIDSLITGDNCGIETECTDNEYYSLFRGLNVIDASQLVLPATTMAEMCYSSMFESCTTLLYPPVLPALTLAVSCYDYMFYECSSMEVAPVLPAETLVESCYSCMFSECSSLIEIRCYALDISAELSTSEWVMGITTAGDFYGKVVWPSGSDGYPATWTFHLIS